jgi:hypothetical protein
VSCRTCLYIYLLPLRTVNPYTYSTIADLIEVHGPPPSIIYTSIFLTNFQQPSAKSGRTCCTTSSPLSSTSTVYPRQRAPIRLAPKATSYSSIFSSMHSPCSPANRIVSLVYKELRSASSPSFIVLQARDAIIQADQNRYSGAHTCILWTAFASRGLGFKAFDYTDDFSVPSGC